MGGTEGGRSPTGVPPTTGARIAGGDSQVTPPNPEVLEKPVRRKYSAEYKQRVLEEADRCSQAGQVAELLRRESLYSSHLNTWRKQRDQGILHGLTPKKRGRRAKRTDPLVEEVERLRRENQQLTTRLKKAETIIDFQKKLSDLMGIPLSTPELRESDA